MLSPAQKRRAAKHVEQGLHVSARRACKALGLARSTHRYKMRSSDLNERLVRRVRELARQYPRYGYRRITALLKLEGWRINRKRGHRVWRREGLKVVVKQHKRRRLGTLANGITRRQATVRNEVWSYDFVMDQTEDGRRLKMLPVVDEQTRECLTVEVERRFKAADVVETLAGLFKKHGAPRYIRSDNGPEFIARAVKEWLKKSGVETLYIEPGSPWENAFVESFNGRFRDELLNREVLTSLTEAKVMVRQYVKEYNEHRPHSSLGYLPPATYAAALKEPLISCGA